MCDVDRARIPAPRTLDRRAFLKGAGAAAALVASRGLVGTALAGGSRRVPTKGISIQLFTMRELMDEDLDGTLEGLRRIGYRIVEHAGFHGRTAKQFRKALDRHDLWSTSGHQSVPHPYDEEAWKRTIDDALTIGQRAIVVPIGPVWEPPTRSTWTQYAHELNEAGALARRHGIALGYHNHNPEFLVRLADDPTSRIYDVLLEETDPAVVHFELDIYWSWAGEQDPVPLLKANPGRFRRFHVKDMDSTTRLWADPGHGSIDFARVFRAAARTQPIGEYIVERDDAGENAMRTARRGYRFLRRIRF